MNNPKVKIFSDLSSTDLEFAINEFLAQERVELVDIKYHYSPQESTPDWEEWHSALLVYLEV